jgi:hypothetical protein
MLSDNVDWITRQLANNLGHYDPTKHQALLREGLLVYTGGSFAELLTKAEYEVRLTQLGYLYYKKDINCLYRIYMRRHYGDNESC